MNETFYGPTAPTLPSSTNVSNYDITAENDVGPGVDIKERTVSYTYETSPHEVGSSFWSVQENLRPS